jgi:glycogen debranching enzyme
MSYHSGSVWPHDNALIALGLSRYGEKGPVTRIFQALFDAAAYMDLRRLPELFCGFARLRGRGPTLYPVACAPQAWASGAFYTLIEASLGIELDPWAREIRFRDPALPAFLDKIVLRELRVGDASVDVSIRRHGDGKLSLQTLKSRGDVQVTMIFRG